MLDLPGAGPEELDLLPLLCACLPEVGSAGRRPTYRATKPDRRRLPVASAPLGTVRGLELN
ncbi:MAG: hypothetical protein R3F36_00895 [Candidatus Competibacteraceae bacterium]